jgi:hypothetical protein
MDFLFSNVILIRLCNRYVFDFASQHIVPSHVQVRILAKMRERLGMPAPAPGSGTPLSSPSTAGGCIITPQSQSIASGIANHRSLFLDKNM